MCFLCVALGGRSHFTLTCHIVFNAKNTSKVTTCMWLSNKVTYKQRLAIRRHDTHGKTWNLFEPRTAYHLAALYRELPESFHFYVPAYSMVLLQLVGGKLYLFLLFLTTEATSSRERCRDAKAITMGFNGSVASCYWRSLSLVYKITFPTKFEQRICVSSMTVYIFFRGEGNILFR